MDLPDEFRDLPPWAATLVTVLGVLVVVSFGLGVLSAGIAIGIELGSPTAGVLAVLGGLALVVVPTVVLVRARVAAPDLETVDESAGPVEELRQQYVVGDLDETTFENRLEELLDGDTESAGSPGPVSDEPEPSLERG